MCKYCQNYKIDIVGRQVLPSIGFGISRIDTYCKICNQKFVADFEEYKLHKLGNPPAAAPSNRMKVVFQEIEDEE